MGIDGAPTVLPRRGRYLALAGPSQEHQTIQWWQDLRSTLTSFAVSSASDGTSHPAVSAHAGRRRSSVARRNGNIDPAKQSVTTPSIMPSASRAMNTR